MGAHCCPAALPHRAPRKLLCTLHIASHSAPACARHVQPPRSAPSAACAAPPCPPPACAAQQQSLEISFHYARALAWAAVGVRAVLAGQWGSAVITLMGERWLVGRGQVGTVLCGVGWIGWRGGVGLGWVGKVK